MLYCTTLHQRNSGSNPDDRYPQFQRTSQTSQNVSSAEQSQVIASYFSVF